MAKPTKRTNSKRAKLLECLRDGCTIKEAAVAAKISRDALNEWRRDDSEFDAEFISAREDGTDELVAIAKKRATEKSDILLMFLIKQRDPSFREQHKVEVEAADNLSNLFEALRQSAPQPEEPEPTP